MANYRRTKTYIHSKSYELENSCAITPAILKNYIQLFDVYTPLQNVDSNLHLLVMCKLGFETPSGHEFKTVADLRRVNFSDQNLIIDYLTERLGVLVDSYNIVNYDQILFTYVKKEGLAVGNRLLLHPNKYEMKGHSFNNLKLPLTMNPLEYGVLLAEQNFKDKVRYIVKSDSRIYVIDVIGNTNNVRIEGAIDMTWTDTKFSDDLFRRELGKNTIWIQNGNIIVKEKILNAKPIKTVKCEKVLSSTTEFMTLDIETIKDGELLKPYLICGYNKDNFIHSFVKDVHSALDRDDMFKDYINQLIKIQGIKYVYAHNLTGFDGVFILKHLIMFRGATAKPLIYNGKLICINFTFKQDGVNRTIVFKDSLLMIPYGFRSLCETFQIATPKTFFPYNLQDINYVGPVPAFNLWNDISRAEYNKILSEFKNKQWSFRDQALIYCKIDCVSLFEVLVKFNKLVHGLFNLNIHKSLTTPALAMRIFKANFMPENSIFQLGGQVEEDIRQSYTGGHVDVYTPHTHVNGDIRNKEHTTLYLYDNNSIYPNAMATIPMPCGKPIAFEGDIRSVQPDAFGFFYCTITSPEYMDKPILQRHIKTTDGLRTIAGLGTWNGWISSYEMDNAIKYGYTFKIHNGYKFRPMIVFKEYVQKMYELRQQYPKGNPLNLIAKLFMNSLYGKFGIKTGIVGKKVNIYI